MSKPFTLIVKTPGKEFRVEFPAWLEKRIFARILSEMKRQSAPPKAKS